MKPLPLKQLTVASTNPGKVGEIRTVLTGLRAWSVLPLPEDLPPVDETGETFLENAILKAEAYSRILGDSAGWVVADDSGIVVDALDGRPGIFSGRYAENDELRNKKLLGELEGVRGDRRSAHFVCTLVLAKQGKALWSTEGRVDGMIAVEPVGRNGFGFDPVFYLPDRELTMGQLPPETKNQISHRGRALAELRRHLESGDFQQPVI